jgi:hypothetical protein
MQVPGNYSLGASTRTVEKSTYFNVGDLNLHVVAQCIHQNIQLLTETCDVNFVKISAHLSHASVAKVTWEIGPM